MNKFSWQKLCCPLFGAQCTPLGMGKTKIICSFLSLYSAYGWRHIFTGRKSKARYLEGLWWRLDQMWTNTQCARPRSRCTGSNGNSGIQTWASGMPDWGESLMSLSPGQEIMLHLFERLWQHFDISCPCNSYASRMMQKKGKKERKQALAPWSVLNSKFNPAEVSIRDRYQTILSPQPSPLPCLDLLFPLIRCFSLHCFSFISPWRAWSIA